MISDILGKSVTIKCSLLVLTNKIELSHKMHCFAKFNGMSSTLSSLYQPKSAKMARNILLTSPNFISSCRNYDEVLSLVFSNNFKIFLSRSNFISKVYNYWCEEIIEIFCNFNWVGNIIISNYSRHITALFGFLGDFMYTLPYCCQIFFILLNIM